MLSSSTYGTSWKEGSGFNQNITYDVDFEAYVTMTFDWQQCLIFIVLHCIGLEALTTPDPFQKDVKVEDPKKPQSNQTKGILMDKIQEHFSTAAESVITFVSVFVVGCVITLSVYSWKKFKPSSWRWVSAIAHMATP